MADSHHSQLHLTYLTIVIDAFNKNRILEARDSPFTSWTDFPPLFSNYLLSWVIYEEGRTVSFFSVVFEIEGSKHGVPPWRYGVYLKRIEFVFKFNLCISYDFFLHFPDKVVNEVTIFIADIAYLFISRANKHDNIVAHLPNFHQAHCQFYLSIIDIKWIFNA